MIAATALWTLLLVPARAQAPAWDQGVSASAILSAARAAAAAAPAPPPAAAAEPTLTPFVDAELLDYVYEKASGLSGRRSLPPQKRPPVYLVSKADLSLIVCPEAPRNCEMLAAVFDDVGYRVLVRSDLEMNSPFEWSFLIHETVHALQYREDGPEIFRDCAAILKTETEAYRVQDEYLKREGQFFRAGTALRFFHCDEAAAAQDYRRSKAVWDERVRTGF